jgi:plasmid stability protein
VLTQDRVRNVAFADLVQHKWAALGRDSPRETGAERDSNVALDHFLETDGGAGHELVGLLVANQDGGSIRDQDVADSGEELLEELVESEVRKGGVGDDLDPLEPVASLPLDLVEPRVLDRDRGPIGGELEQIHVVGREIAWRQGSDVQDAEHVAPHDERHADHALDALLAEERVQDVGVLDVVEDDRPSLGCDLAGEAATDRDPDAALDLFFETDRGAGHELLSLLVEEEDRHGVGFEDVADSPQQLSKEIVQLEVRECGVGDNLESPKALRIGAFVHGRSIRRSAEDLLYAGLGPGTGPVLGQLAGEAAASDDPLRARSRALPKLAVGGDEPEAFARLRQACGLARQPVVSALAARADCAFGRVAVEDDDRVVSVLVGPAVSELDELLLGNVRPFRPQDVAGVDQNGAGGLLR